MKLFTVGPVEMDPVILEIGSRPIPYFRTQTFSNKMLQMEENFLPLMDAPVGSKMAILTASGSGAMESVVASIFTKKDKLLIINAGTFGKRFIQLATIHELNYETIDVPFEKDLVAEDLNKFENMGITGILVQASETSIGKKMDLTMLGNFSKRNKCILVVDAVSGFLVDQLSMKNMNIDVCLTSSQKALALAPGLSIVVCTKEIVQNQIETNRRKQLYLDLKDAFINAKRGQTPFTPALSIIDQLDYRIKEIHSMGGTDHIIEETKNLAIYFREKLKEITEFSLPSFQLTNGLTPVKTGSIDAYKLFYSLMDEDGMVVTPCGGDLATTLIRVGHMGYLKKEDYDTLIRCIKKNLK